MALSEVRKVICLVLKIKYEMTQGAITYYTGQHNRASVSVSISQALSHIEYKDRVFMRYFNDMIRLMRSAKIRVNKSQSAC